MYTISETTVVGIVFSKKSHLHIVVAHISVRTVAVLIAVVTLAVTRRCCLEIYFGQQSRAVDAVLPVGRAQLVQGNGCVEALCACKEYCLFER